MTDFNPSEWAALDLETFSLVDPAYPLQPFRMKHGEAAIRSIALTWWSGNDYKSKSWYMPDTATLKKILASIKDKKVVGWNTPFDVAWLLAAGCEDEVAAIWWMDAMLLWRHLDVEREEEGRKPRSYGLKAAVANFYPEDAGYEDGTVELFFGELDAHGIEKLLKYNEDDTFHTFRFAWNFWSELNDRQRRVAALEARCIPMVAETYLSGIELDSLALIELGENLDNITNEMYDKLSQEYTGDVEISSDLLNSPKQLSNLLFNIWGLPSVKLTDAGNESTDKEVLHELSFIDERAKTLRAYRESVNNKTKFVNSPLISMAYNGDGCTRPQARIFGTYTGRMTYSSKQGKGVNEKPTGIALHQWKRDPAYRRSIVAPEGFLLCEFDFAGQEFRWMAVESGDEKMLELCAPGEDAHSYMGSRIWVQEDPDEGADYRHLIALVHDGDKPAKAHRQMGKVANLSLQYRTSAPKLRSVARVQHNIPMSLDQAELIHNMYQVAYPGVPDYWERQISLGRNQGYIENLAGRRVQLRGNWASRNTKWALESTSINFPIQSIGADQKYLALMVLRDYLPSIGGHFYFELHDGLFVLLPEKTAHRDAPKIRALLSTLPYKKAWGLDLPIQFPVDAKVGPSWGDLTELKM